MILYKLSHLFYEDLNICELTVAKNNYKNENDDNNTSNNNNNNNNASNSELFTCLKAAIYKINLPSYKNEN